MDHFQHRDEADLSDEEVLRSFDPKTGIKSRQRIAMTAAVAQSASRALAAFAIVWSVSSPAWAQWEPYPWKNMPRTADGKVDMNAPPRRTADGKIDLSGFWMPTDRGEAPAQPGRRPEAGGSAAAAVGGRRSTRSASRPTARIIRACAAGRPAFPRRSTFPTASRSCRRRT